MLAFSTKNQALLVKSALWGAQQIWERAFEAVPDVMRVTTDDYGLLKTLLSDCDDLDSYLTTPNYYCYTGRNGLWLYRQGNTFIPVCWHPNVPGEVLVFPQFARQEYDLLPDLLRFIPAAPAGIRIARARPNANWDHYNFSTAGRSVALSRCEETVLDWRYPVHLLDTAQVAALKGGKYMHTRNRLRQLKAKVDVKTFDAVAHSRALENLLHRWALHGAADRDEYEELYAPYESLFSWSLEPESGLEGLMIFVDDSLQAVALWDVCNKRHDTANLFVNFCNVDIAGLSELLIVKSCEDLQSRNVRYLNLGGSETPGLDTYKRKFDPAISIDLCSIKIDVAENSLSRIDSHAAA